MSLRILVLALITMAMMSQTLPAAMALAATSRVHVADVQQPGGAQIDVDINGGGEWWTNPAWIAIGILAVVVLVTLIAMVVRGGNTTIIKE